MRTLDDSPHGQKPGAIDRQCRDVSRDIVQVVRRDRVTAVAVYSRKIVAAKAKGNPGLDTDKVTLAAASCHPRATVAAA